MAIFDPRISNIELCYTIPMSKIITFVGVSGVGKTSLVNALAKTGNFATGLEEHETRPFQHLFDVDKRYALPNQIDYFLLRAEQERMLRARPEPALVDGGLDVDFYGFARLFHARGYLNDAEFELCERLYTQLRFSLPMPEMVVYLTASDDVVRQRLAKRDRVNIVTAEDADLLTTYFEAWLETLPREKVLRLDVSKIDLSYRAVLPELRQRIQAL